MAVTTREELKQYCLRKLGAPALNIDVTDAQLEDRISDALDLFKEQHFDGIDVVYYKHQVTAQDKINRYITMPDNILGAIHLFPIQSTGGRVGDIFDVQYQIAMNDLYNLTTVSMVPYVLTMTQLEVINQILVGQVPIRYNKVGQKLYLDMSWNRVAEGQWLVIEAHQVVDPADAPALWNDRWLLAYATALIKRQWGTNLSKFVGVRLPGDIMLNGPLIFQQAEDEIEQLREELMDRYSWPVIGFVG